MVFSLNFQLNTKRYVPKAFLSPFVDGIAMVQTLARRYAIPPHTAPLLALAGSKAVEFIANSSCDFTKRTGINQKQDWTRHRMDHQCVLAPHDLDTLLQRSEHVLRPENLDDDDEDYS